MAPILLLTRPRAQSERFARLAVERFGSAVEVMISPILKIEPVAFHIPDAVKTLIFSSENAVHAAAAHAKPRLLAYCVGDRTAKVAENAGFNAISAQGDADALVKRIISDAPQGPLLYLHGAVFRTDVAAALRAAGFDARAQVAYRQIPCPLSDPARDALKDDVPVILALFSPRSAALLSDAAQNAAAPLRIAALSANVARAWDGPKATMLVAEKPDAPHLLDRVAALLGKPLP